MDNSKIIKIFTIFAFGLTVGSFGAATVVREGVPVSNALLILILMSIFYAVIA